MSDFINITAANCFLDASGANIASGTLTVIATDARDNPIPFRIGASKQASRQTVTRVITAGSMVGTLQLADPASSSPLNVLYRFTVTDNATNKVSTYIKVPITADGSGNWDFGSMNTGALLPQIPYTVVTGPAGRDGVDGANGSLADTNKGIYSAATTYAVGDVVSVAGSTYISLAATNLNHSPASATPTVPTAWWQVLSQAGEVSGVKLAAFNAAQVSPLSNVFDSTKAQTGFYVNWTTGVVAALSGYTITGKMLANSGGMMTCNQWQNGNNPSGIAFYDVNGVYISGLAGPIAPNTPFAVPATAVYVILTFKPGDYTASTMMVVWGSVMPGTYTSFAKAAASDVSTLAASTAASLATNTAGIAVNLAALNLLDPAGVTLSSYIDSGSGNLAAATGSYANYASSGYISVAPGMKFTMNKPIVLLNSVGLAFYKQKVYVSGIPGLVAAGTVITVPAGVDSFRVTMQGPDQYTQTITTTAGNGLTAVAAAASAPIQVFVGKNLAVFGDSYTATFGNKWLPQLSTLTGFTVALNKSQSGRKTQNIFDDYPAGGTTTLAQLTTALANIDCVLIPMGTNDIGNINSLGAPGDAATAATEYGYVRNAIEMIQQAKPSVRIIWVGQLYYSAAAYSGGSGATPAQAAQLIAAIKYVCNSYGVPYLDMFAISGVNNFNWAYYLRDGVHMTDAAYGSVFAPLIARAMAQYIAIV